MMSTFIQIHFLTSFPPSNLNRDDMGRPKSARMGGVDRLRVSSQSLKRAWRTSDLFKSAMAGHIGTRTKELGHEVYNRFIEAQIKPKDAKLWAQAIAGVFGTLKSEDRANPEKNVDLEIEQLCHISPEEWTAVNTLIHDLVNQKRAPIDKELILLRHPETAVDIALFGRMLASSPLYNVDAACQVSHAISVHPVVIEDDYFTAVDDLNQATDNLGAAHIGESGFGSALFYTYACINRSLLVENLGNDSDLANKAIGALIETAAKVAPEGKQNSFASRARASYIRIEKGEAQPRSLSVAFLKPITGNNYGEDAIKILEKTASNLDKVYGIEGLQTKTLDAFKGEGTLADLVKFAQE